MPLSEHEQRMLEQIENALYAEDPKFASSVRRRRLGGSPARRRAQAIAVFVVGLALLVGGLFVIDLGGFFIAISVVGFLMMFGAGLMVMWGGAGNSQGSSDGETVATKRPKSRRFSERMEDRFNRRFDQDR